MKQEPGIRTRSSLFRIKIKIILASFIHFFFLLNSTGQYLEELYSMEHGLSHNTILSIEKDKYGFIWVGTFQGIDRFDGYRFSSLSELGVKHPGGMYKADTKVRMDYKERLWIYTNEGRFLYDQKLNSLQQQWKMAWKKGFFSCECLIDQDDVEWVYDDHGRLFRFPERTDLLGEAFEVKLPDELGRIEHMFLSSDGHIWVGSSNGLYGIAINDDQVEFIPKNIIIEDNENVDFKILKIIAGKTYLWCVTDHGLLKTDIDKISGQTTGRDARGVLTRFDRPELLLTPESYIQTAVWGEGNDMYFRTKDGIYRYETQIEKLERVRKEDYADYDRSEGNFQKVMLYDNSGILWVATDKGLCKIVIGKKDFNIIKPDPENNSGLNNNKLNQVLVDNTGNLWVGTVGGGLYHSKRNSEKDYIDFKQYLPDKNDPYSIQGKSISTLFQDSRGIIWVNAADFLQWFDPSEVAPRFNQIDISEYASITKMWHGGNRIVEDASGNLVFLGDYGSWVYSPSLKKGYCLIRDGIRELLIRPRINISENGKIYYIAKNTVYTVDGSWVFSEGLSPEEIRNNAYQDSMDYLDILPVAYPEKLTALIDFSDNQPGINLISFGTDSSDFWLTADRTQELLHCTLVYDHSINGNTTLKASLSEVYAAKDGLSPTSVNEIVEDHRGRIWCSKQDGLFCLDPATKIVTNYYESDGLPTNKFFWGCDTDSNGRIFLCTTNGLVYFHPDSITPDPKPPVYITGFKLFHKNVGFGPDSLLNENILTAASLQLPFNKNFLEFEFAALDFRNTNKVQYKYKMEGLDSDWIEVENRRIADYPNLKPGRYTFKVIAANGNRVWNMEGASIDIRIIPPFWLKWWAYLIYGLMLLGIAYWYRQFLLNRTKLKTELKIERILKEQVQELDTMKSRFFANISHEFRTPLTLITGPINDLMNEDYGLNEGARKLLGIMKRNSQRLMQLINQLLELSKLETGKVKLEVLEGDLSGFVKPVILSFLSLAERKKIQYKHDIRETPDHIYFDKDKVEKIITNLISNALKFTQEGGSVAVKVHYLPAHANSSELRAEIVIKDTGPGIPAEEREKIFERFHQVSSTDNRSFEGSGIGLSLTKELVDLYRGEIQLESEIGKGSTFSVTLPASRESFNEDELIITGTTSENIPVSTAVESDHRVETLAQKNVIRKYDHDKPVILVVEDNTDLRDYISQNLLLNYQILEAENGRLGLQKAIESIPDLVISDLMMPEMDGIEMCEHLKSDHRTSHIPLIMLTAKADKTSKMESLETGADDYILKPFDAEELQARVRNLIEQRKRLRERYRKEFLTDLGTDGLTEPADEFLDKLIACLKKNLINSEYNVQQLSQDVGLSQSQLYRKMLALTDHSPNEFIRNSRLKMAAGMFQQGHKNITTVLYSVGFSTPSHFSKCFKQLFGVIPSEYIRQIASANPD